MSTFWNTHSTRCCENLEQQELSLILIRIQNATTTLEDSLAVFCKAKRTFTILYGQAITLLCIYPIELRAYIYIKSGHEHK